MYFYVFSVFMGFLSVLTQGCPTRVCPQFKASICVLHDPGAQYIVHVKGTSQFIVVIDD